MKPGLTKMWMFHAIESPARMSGTDSNVCRCCAIHSEARHNYFADVLLAQPEARNDSQQVNRWNVLLLLYFPAPKGCG